MDQQEVTFTYSGVVQKDGRNAVCIRFERKNEHGLDVAEGTVPDCTLTQVSGFSKEEVSDLERYLTENSVEIIENARKLSNFKNLFS